MADVSINVTLYCQDMQAIKQTTNVDAIWRNASGIAALVYGVPSLLLNLRIYTIILKNRKRKDFSSTFFRVFLIASIVDTSWWVTNQLKDHAGVSPVLTFLISWMPESGIIINVWFFLIIYFMLTDFLMSPLVSLNRFVTITFDNGDRIWHKIFPYCLTIIFIFPIFFTWQFWFDTIVKCTIFIDGNRYYFVNPLAETYGLRVSLCQFSFSFFSSFLNILLNMGSIISIFKQRKKLSPSNKEFKKFNGPELKLFFVTLIMFLNQSILSGIHLTFFIFNSFPHPTIAQRLFEASRLVIDLMCLSPSWLLVIMSKSVQKEVIPKFLKASNCVNTNSVSVASSSNPPLLISNCDTNISIREWRFSDLRDGFQRSTNWTTLY